ncbi:BspA family leucine-rich repeat surface protein, partial [Leuconostoc citreum]
MVKKFLLTKIIIVVAVISQSFIVLCGKVSAADNVSIPIVKISNTIESNWGDSPVIFDNATGLLTIGSGNLGKYNQFPTSIDKNSVTSIKISDGVVLPTDSMYLFSDFKNVTEYIGTIKTSNVTNMWSMFSGNTKLKQLDTSMFDTSKVTNMRYLFSNCESLGQLDVSNFDTSNVKDMEAIFSNTKKLTSLKGVENFNTSKVTDIAYAFNLSGLTNLNLNNWDVSQVKTSYTNSFSNMPNLERISLQNWNVTNSYGILECFSNDPHLKILDISGWNTEKFQYFDSAFSNTNLESITLGSKTILNTKVKLPSIDTSTGKYTGRWVRINPAYPDSQYNSSTMFMSEYDGTNPGTYVWEQVKSSGDVTVKYVNEQGAPISDNTVLSGKFGDSYNTDQKEIKGYTFKEVQ